MSTFKSNMMILMTLMLVSMHCYNTVAQTTHTVGASLGWTIPPNGPSDYVTWASGQTFSVGDVLLFNFTTGAHTVAEVSQAAYGPCTTTNPISVTTTGPARLTLNAPGTHYYICTVVGHCQTGQKLTINVRPATSATPAPAPAPTSTTNAPVASPTAAPTSSPTTTPTPSTTVSPPASSPSPSQSDVSPPTSSTGQSPSGSTTPSPTGSTTLPPPSPSGVGSSYAVAVPFTFLAAALAFFY
ncbi:uclacyanin 1-like [Rutidosis leptorrhynchoides]|uniref:uclacyanin 1-like n=1 Tax=Rutidosis leptorrhynchoides TaxID=125765 RepID=UPI003A992C9B